MGRRRLLAGSWTAAVLLACLIPGRFLKGAEGRLRSGFPIDKVVHAAMFFWFAAIWTQAVPGGRSRAVVLVVGALLAVGT